MEGIEIEGGRPCPFCDGTAADTTCGKCGRDVTASRRPCKACGKFTPTADKACCHCGAHHGSELSWKIPLIILIFALGIGLAIVLQLAR